MKIRPLRFDDCSRAPTHTCSTPARFIPRLTLTFELVLANRVTTMGLLPSGNWRTVHCERPRCARYRVLHSTSLPSSRAGIDGLPRHVGRGRGRLTRRLTSRPYERQEVSAHVTRRSVEAFPICRGFQLSYPRLSRYAAMTSIVRTPSTAAADAAPVALFRSCGSGRDSRSPDGERLVRCRDREQCHRCLVPVTSARRLTRHLNGH